MRNGKCIHGNGLFKENSNLLNNYEEMFDYVVYKNLMKTEVQIFLI